MPIQIEAVYENGVLMALRPLAPMIVENNLIHSNHGEIALPFTSMIPPNDFHPDARPSERM